MPNLKTRLENLEKKMFCDKEDMPSCIIICSESARLDAVPDGSPIIRLICDNVNYDRKSQESEENFVTRVAALAKALLPSPHAIPSLLAVTENMMADSSL
jgi:hypothetical protein